MGTHFEPMNQDCEAADEGGVGALQYAAEIAQEVFEVVVWLFGLNVEISVPIISPAAVLMLLG